MPALQFMGRRWGVGGDEFALPSLCSMALRVVWSLALVVILFEVGGDLRGCADGWLVYTYMLGSLTTFTLSVVVEWGITRVSTLGSIADTAPRASLSKYLNLHMLLGVVQLFLAGLGIVLVTYFDHTCRGLFSDEALNILLAVVVASQIVDVGVTGCCCVLMRGNVHERIPDGLEDENQGLYERFAPTEIEGQWESRCHWLYRALVLVTCGLFGGQGSTQSDFEQLARVMARIFHTEEYLDVVPSDIAAGIVLLYHKQRERWMSTSSWRSTHLAGRFDCHGSIDGVEAGGSVLPNQVPTMDRIGGGNGQRARDSIPAGLRTRSSEHPYFFKVASRPLLDIKAPEDRRTLEEIAHFARYSLAIYTWYLYIFDRPCCGVWDLLCFSCTRRAHAFHKTRNESAKSLCESRASSCPDISEGMTSNDCEGPGALSMGSRGWETLSDSAGEGREERRDIERGSASSATNERARAGWTSQGGGSNDVVNRDNRVTVSVRGDNWLGIHEAALLRVAGLHPNCEVIDAQFRDDVQATPYCIMVDHIWRCVVVAIRGTMSLDDCLCDLQAEPVSMAESGRKWGFDGNDMFAHQGVLTRAEWVRQDLEKEGHLRALLGLSGAGSDIGPDRRTNGYHPVSPGEEAEVASYSGATAMSDGNRGSINSGGNEEHGRFRRRPALSSRHVRCRGYALRVTGHSLGGSTSILLTYMLRRDYPSVRCIAISPLGGLLNSPHAENCGDFVTSAVMGDDVIPRLSVSAMERMRDEILELISRSKVNKMTVMRSLVRGFPTSQATMRSVQPRSDDDLPSSCNSNVLGLVYEPHELVPRTGYYNQLRRYREWVDRKRQESTSPELLPAGRFVHFVNTAATSRWCRSRRQYTPVWATPSDFVDIEVSKRMFVDHFPTTSCPRFTETLEDLIHEAGEAGRQWESIGLRSGLVGSVQQQGGDCRVPAAVVGNSSS